MSRCAGFLTKCRGIGFFRRIAYNPHVSAWIKLYYGGGYAPRVAHPTDAWDEILRFYRDGLGFEVIDSFTDHDGFDGVMLGHRGQQYHFEFTRKRGHAAGRAPTQDNLLVFYFPDAQEWERAVARMIEHGYAPFPVQSLLGCAWQDVRGRRWLPCGPSAGRMGIGVARLESCHVRLHLPRLTERGRSACRADRLDPRRAQIFERDYFYLRLELARFDPLPDLSGPLGDGFGRESTSGPCDLKSRCP